LYLIIVVCGNKKRNHKSSELEWDGPRRLLRWILHLPIMQLVNVRVVCFQLKFPRELTVYKNQNKMSFPLVFGLHSPGTATEDMASGWHSVSTFTCWKALLGADWRCLESERRVSANTHTHLHTHTHTHIATRTRCMSTGGRHEALSAAVSLYCKSWNIDGGWMLRASDQQAATSAAALNHDGPTQRANGWRALMKRGRRSLLSSKRAHGSNGSQPSALFVRPVANQRDTMSTLSKNGGGGGGGKEKENFQAAGMLTSSQKPDGRPRSV